MTAGWDVPDFGLEPPEEPADMAWCGRCRNWAACPCGCGWGWCDRCGEMVRPDETQDCGDFNGEPPELGDDPT